MVYRYTGIVHTFYTCTCMAVYLYTCTPACVSSTFAVCSKYTGIQVCVCTCYTGMPAWCTGIQVLYILVHLYTCIPVWLYTCTPVQLHACALLSQYAATVQVYRCVYVLVIQVCQPGVPVYRYCTYLYTCIPVYLYGCIPVHLYTCMRVLYFRSMQQLYKYTGVYMYLLYRYASLVYRYTGIVHTCTPVYLYTCMAVYLYTCTPACVCSTFAVCSNCTGIQVSIRAV